MARNASALLEAVNGLGVSVVYAVRVGEFVKIGYTIGRLSTRLTGIAVNCPYPYELLAAKPGARKEELELHRHLRDSRSHGEWFHDNQQVRAWVDQFMSVTPDEFYKAAIAGGVWPEKKQKLLRDLNERWFSKRRPSASHGAEKEMA
jgi:hypothetical protein